MRIKVSTLVILAAVVGVAALMIKVLRPPKAVDAQADGAAVDAGAEPVHTASRVRPRSVPHFVTTPAAPEPVAPVTPPPQEQPPPPPPPSDSEAARAALKERASKDGFLFQEEGSPAVYVVQGGTKFHIPSPNEFRSFGYNTARIETVPAGSLNFLRERPPDKGLYRERDSAGIYYFENSQKRLIPNDEVLQKLGLKKDDVKVIPTGGLRNEATGPPMQ